MHPALITRFLTAGLFFFALGKAHADTVDARCDVYPKGSDKATAMLACTFSQRQGYVSITRADGVRHELSPRVAGGAGTYVDEAGKPAYRTRGLGCRGQIYRLERESVYVYWDTAGLPGKGGVSAPGGRDADRSADHAQTERARRSHAGLARGQVSCVQQK
jgi:hypothetical protein